MESPDQPQPLSPKDDPPDEPPPPPPPPPRLHSFQLHRDVDATGISGIGVVAQGVVFNNGKVAMSWCTPHTSVAIYDDVPTVIAIHGHGGQTRLVFDE